MLEHTAFQNTKHPPWVQTELHLYLVTKPKAAGIHTSIVTLGHKKWYT
jgi:hypothetical protein